MSVVSDVFTAVESVVTSAGASVTPAIAQILAGEPGQLSNYTVLAWWYLGEQEWESNTMSRTQRMLGFRIVGYWPGSIRTQAPNRNLELEVANLGRALYAGFMNHVFLSNAATGQGLEIGSGGKGDVPAGWTTIGDVLARTITCEVWVYISAPDVIAA